MAPSHAISLVRWTWEICYVIPRCQFMVFVWLLLYNVLVKMLNLYVLLWYLEVCKYQAKVSYSNVFRQLAYMLFCLLTLLCSCISNVNVHIKRAGDFESNTDTLSGRPMLSHDGNTFIRHFCARSCFRMIFNDWPLLLIGCQNFHLWIYMYV